MCKCRFACIKVNVPEIAVGEVCRGVCVELAVSILITGPLTRGSVIDPFIANVITWEIYSFKSSVDPAWWQRSKVRLLAEPHKYNTINKLKGERLSY